MKRVQLTLHGIASSRQPQGSLRNTSRALIPALSLLMLFTSAAACAQTGNTTQYLFGVQGGVTPAIVTYIVDQTTGALTSPVGVNPTRMRASPSWPATPAVNPAGTFLFVPSLNSKGVSAVSVFSISSTGAVTELAASPFSASDGSVPLGYAVSLDGQYLYAASSGSSAPASTALLNVYSIGPDGTLTPVGSYPLPSVTLFLYLHPTGRWLYTYGAPDTVTSSIEEFTVGPSGTLTDNGGFKLSTYSSSPAGLVGDNAGKYLFALHGQFHGPSTMIDTHSVNGGGGVLSPVSTYSTTAADSNQSEYEAVDSTGGFLFSTFANFSNTNGVLTLLQSNQYFSQFPAPPLLASRTSPFLFATGSTISGYYLSSDLIGSGGGLTPAPGSPYTIPLGIVMFAVTGSVPAPTAPALTLPVNSINFSSVSPGQTTTSTINLSSTGFSPLVINNISVSGDPSFSQTSNCVTSLAPGATCTVNLKFAPTSAGTFMGDLNIASNAPAATVLRTGTTAPAVSAPFISPNSLTFPSTVLGVPSATQTFTVTNLPAATASLQVSGVAISGSNPNDFSQTNNCTTAIPAGGSCSIVVTFTPLAVGGRSATLVTTTNNPNTLTLSNLLVGEGVVAPTQYSLQTSAVGPGTIQQAPSGTSFNANTSIILTAIPNVNATFTSWSGACAGSTNAVCTFSITANTTATATFTPNPAVSVTQGQQSGAAGSTFTFQISETGFTTQPTLTASCSIPKGSCSISGNMLIVTTKAASSSIVPINFPRGPLTLMLTLAIMLVWASPRTKRFLRPAVLVGGLILLAGCNASGGGGTIPNTGTTPATYTITIQATAGAQTATTTVSVVVR